MYDALRHPQAQWYPVCKVCMTIREDGLATEVGRGSQPSWAWTNGSAQNHSHELGNHEDLEALTEEFATALVSRGWAIIHSFCARDYVCISRYFLFDGQTRFIMNVRRLGSRSVTLAIGSMVSPCLGNTERYGWNSEIMGGSACRPGAVESHGRFGGGVRYPPCLVKFVVGRDRGGLEAFPSRRVFNCFFCCYAWCGSSRGAILPCSGLRQSRYRTILIVLIHFDLLLLHMAWQHRKRHLGNVVWNGDVTNSVHICPWVVRRCCSLGVSGLQVKSDRGIGLCHL